MLILLYGNVIDNNANYDIIIKKIEPQKKATNGKK